jgi:hypothetical protein
MSGQHKVIAVKRPVGPQEGVGLRAHVQCIGEFQRSGHCIQIAHMRQSLSRASLRWHRSREEGGPPRHHIMLGEHQ